VDRVPAGPENEDLSHVISKVVFNLHPSFKEAARTLEKPPYEVTETGWGEFEIGITVHFSDDLGRNPSISPRRSSSTKRGADGKQEKKEQKKPVIKEKYEEMVFHEPDESFLKRVKAHKTKQAPTTEITPVLGKRDDTDELLKDRNREEGGGGANVGAQGSARRADLIYI
jgi:YEATS domain-containing protein 4